MFKAEARTQTEKLKHQVQPKKEEEKKELVSSALSLDNSYLYDYLKKDRGM